jgi:hypothetical protein
VPRSTSKKRAGGRKSGPRDKAATRRPRALPPPEAIISVEEFTSPKSKKTYQVIETTERDAYDKIEQGQIKRTGRAKKKRRAGD